ncbi:MAG: DUF2066 domain-containing protein [Gammaproteobacteria bacterium]|nr:DUF2066 domain-containing protein [Gammaproteobacteria bacterium]
MKCQQNNNFIALRQFIFIILASLLLAQPVFSASVAKLYETSIRVDLNEVEKKAGGKERTESELIKDAFTRVLIKVSGRSDVKSSPNYQEMLNKAESAISQFRYDYRVASTSDELNDAASDDSVDEPSKQKEKWFWVRFNSKVVNDLLNEAQISIWGKIRPETLIWFSQEVQGKRQLYSQHDAPEVYAVLKQQAEQRGISLIFPFLDLQDQSSLSASDIWGNFNDAILLASRRYQAQSTLTSRLFKERSGLWVSQWNLLMLGEVHTWEVRDEKLEEALASGIDKLADQLSHQFTQVDSGEVDAGILVQINNVTGFKAFQEVDDYLSNLATVKSVNLVHTEHDKLIYSIDYLNSKSSFVQEIRLGDLLNSVERTRTNEEQDSNLSNNSYKPVILNNMNDREKALNSLDSTNKTTAVQPVEEIKIEREPDLEYWLAR